MLSSEEKEVFKEAFSKFDKDGSGNISTKVQDKKLNKGRLNNQKNEKFKNK